MQIKILIVTGRFGSNYAGGIARVTNELCKRLVKNHQIMVVSHKRLKDKTSISGIDVKAISSFNIPKTNFWHFFYLWNKKRAVKKFVKQFKPDVIYAHTPLDTLASLENNVPVVSHVHSLYTEHFLKQEASRTLLPDSYWKWFWKYRLSLENNALSKCNLVITYSSYLADLARERGAKNVVIIPNGIDRTVFSPDGEKLEQIRKPSVMFVGRIEKVKGIQSLAEAAKKLPDCNFYLIGEKVDDFDFPSNMHLLGKKEPSEIPKFLKSADVFVNPVLRDGFEIVNIEAMACGLPVITTNAYERTTLYKDVSVLVQPGKTDELVSAISNLLGDEKLRDDFVKKGLDFSSEFDWEKISLIVEKELQNLVN